MCQRRAKPGIKILPRCRTVYAKCIDQRRYGLGLNIPKTMELRYDPMAPNSGYGSGQIEL